MEINIDKDLAIARMGLLMGSPMQFNTKNGSVIITPWDNYSMIYKEKVGVYPEMWGYVTHTDESIAKCYSTTNQK